MGVWRCDTQTVSWLWKDCSAKSVNVHRVFLIVVVFDVIMLQENGCLLLWPDCAGLSLQSCQCRDWGPSDLMDCLGSSKCWRISPFLSQKTVHITLTAESCVLNFFFWRKFSCCHSMHSSSFDSVLQWCHHISSLVMMCCKKLSSWALCGFSCSWQAYTVLSVPVWVLVDSSWCKGWYILMLTLSFRVHEVQ